MLNLNIFIPRILSNIDTNPFSPTYGCADKAYWWYKTKEFPNARCQEFVLTLAILAKRKHRLNTYYNNQQLSELAAAGLNFLVKIQNKDGSFNEWYNNEHSFVATAFSMAKAADTFQLLELSIHEEKGIQFMFNKAASWLVSAKEEVSNQLAGSAYALLTVSKILENTNYLTEAENKLLLLEKLQTNEGWFYEYGGPDFGYLQLLIDFLARYHEATSNDKCLQLARNAFIFLQHFIHPDGTCGGIYGSRGTSFTFPYGINYFSSFIPEAGHMSKLIKHTSPEEMDDNFALQYNDSMLLSLFYDTHTECKAITTKKKMALFEKAGLFIYNDKYYFVSNLRKGGVFKLYSNNKHVMTDAGIWANKGSKILTTQWNNSSTYSFDEKSKKIIINGNFVFVPAQNINTKKSILFKATISGMPSFLVMQLKKFLRHNLIIKPKLSNITYERRFYFGANFLEVEDVINSGSELNNIKCLSNANAQYTPTSMFCFDEKITVNENKLSWQKIGNTYISSRRIEL